jgi:hypothetical protein
MNAPFDPVGVAEAAMRAVEAGEGPLILSRRVPLESARQLIQRRYTQVGGRAIHHQQGVFYVWDGTHYRETSRDEIRAFVYEFLDSAKCLDSNSKPVPFNPNRAKVGDVVEALAAVSQLPELLRTPIWLDADEHSSHGHLRVQQWSPAPAYANPAAAYAGLLLRQCRRLSI